MIRDVVGTWDMVHDDWKGTLVIRRSDVELNEAGEDGLAPPATNVL